MSTEKSTLSERITETDVFPRAKYLIVSYPAITLSLFFVVPLLLLVVVSTFQNVEGGFFEPAFTLENYVRFIGSDLFQGRMLYTLRVAGLTTGLCLAIGYPLAYYIATLKNELWRRVYLSIIVSSLFLTFIIRAFAWQVLLSSDSIVPSIATAIGLLEEPVALVPSYFALVIGMVYVFLPFMVLTLYTSIRDVDKSLQEASRSLGARPLRTFREVTLPLTKSGIISGSMLVFVLSLGVYVLPRILGNPPQWTLAVLIGNQVGVEGNIPYGATISIVLLIVVGIILGTGWYLTSAGRRRSL
ncbi:ABC transporter permease [Halonotius sp. F2-221B]|uniref:ABC transporter permease n=1 Tax=Halonotius sp. F2-221B TaxID=2731620 RepID=UPI00398B0D30